MESKALQQLVASTLLEYELCVSCKTLTLWTKSQQQKCLSLYIDSALEVADKESKNLQNKFSINFTLCTSEIAAFPVALMKAV